MSSLKTHQYQRNLASYCRTGEYVSIPGVNEKHIKQYRRLVYNVVYDTLENAYPLTKSLLTTEEWDGLVQDFFSSNNCSSPQIWRMPKELFLYVENSGEKLTDKYPFLIELLHFEWLEIEIYMMEDEDLLEYRKEGDLAKDALYLNPELQILGLSYPVHIKSAKLITPEDVGQYFVVIHRHSKTGKVVFTEINYAHLVLLEQLSVAPTSLANLKVLWQESFSQEEINQALPPFIENCLATNLILGFV